MELQALTSCDKGRKVVYTERFTGVLEEGVITSWNSFYLFVRYGSDSGSKATDAGDLEFV